MNSGCLDDQTIAALMDGTMDPPARAAAHAHLVGCDDCQTLVAAIGLSLRDEARLDALPAVPPGLEAWAVAAATPQPRPWQIVVRRIAQGLEALAESLQPLPAAALAVRGAQPEAAPLRYQIEAHQNRLELCLTAIDRHRTALSVTVPEPPLQPCRAELMRDGELISSIALDQRDARLAELGAGQYTLKIVMPQQPAVELPIRLDG